jgi:transcriptional regulator with XRE-family HTH domain
MGARLSQAELASAIGVTRQTISRWEQGRFRPDNADDVVAFAQATKVDPDEALAAAGFRPSAEPPPAAPAPPMDEDVQVILDRLADPAVSEQEKILIRAQLRYLAELSEQRRTPRRG